MAGKKKANQDEPTSSIGDTGDLAEPTEGAGELPDLPALLYCSPGEFPAGGKKSYGTKHVTTPEELEKALEGGEWFVSKDEAIAKAASK